jgi:hypothetical protein
MSFASPRTAMPRRVLALSDGWMKTAYLTVTRQLSA